MAPFRKHIDYIRLWYEEVVLSPNNFCVTINTYTFAWLLEAQLTETFSLLPQSLDYLWSDPLFWIIPHDTDYRQNTIKLSMKNLLTFGSNILTYHPMG